MSHPATFILTPTLPEHSDDLRKRVFVLTSRLLTIPEMNVAEYFKSLNIFYRSEHYFEAFERRKHLTVDQLLRNALRSDSVPAGKQDLWDFLILSKTGTRPENALAFLFQTYKNAALQEDPVTLPGTTDLFPSGEVVTVDDGRQWVE